MEYVATAMYRAGRDGYSALGLSTSPAIPTSTCAQDNSNPCKTVHENFAACSLLPKQLNTHTAI